MKILDRDISRDLITRIDQSKKGKKPKAILNYATPLKDANNVAHAIVAAAHPFETGYLICKSFPFGDFWKQGRQDWEEFYAWRSRFGVAERLADIPGHQFMEIEQNEFAKCLAFALRLGWDAVAWTIPGRDILELSHDDRIEIHRGFNWRELSISLEKSGFSLAQR